MLTLKKFAWSYNWDCYHIYSGCSCDLPYCSVFYKYSRSHSISSTLSQGHQQSQAVFGWSQIVSLISAPSKVICPEKLTIKHSDNYNGTSELSLYTLNGMELLHNLQHCSHALMYTTYTHKLHIWCS